MKLVKTQVVSDPVQPLCSPRGSVLLQHEASGWCIALVSLFSPDKEHHLLEEVLGAFVWTFLYFKYKLWLYIWLRDRNSGLRHSAFAHSLWSSEGTD